jgi:uncharacterized protein (DUF1697 family)
MKTFLSLIRGVNMGNRNRVKMNALMAMYEAMGFHQVRTCLQSGNVIFQSTVKNKRELEKMISVQIATLFCFDTDVIVLDTGDLNKIVQNKPFEDNGLHITLLSRKPHSINIDIIDSKCSENERYKIVGKTIYLYMPDGYAGTKINNNFFEKTLNVRATTRTWKTMKILITEIKTHTGK